MNAFETTRVTSCVKTHSVIRKLLLGAAFVGSSVALFLGVGVYALTTGPKAIGDFMADRRAALAWIAFAFTLDLAIALLLRAHKPLLARFGLAVLASVLGAVLMFALVVIRGVLAHQAEM